MRTLKRIVFAAVFLTSMGVFSCKTTSTTGGGGGTTVVPPVVTGVVDCGEPSLWKVINFASLISLAETAIAQQDPVGALTHLVEQYGEAEVACVAANINSQSTKQQVSAPSNSLAATRVSVTADWLKRARGKGLEPKNFDSTVQ